MTGCGYQANFMIRHFFLQALGNLIGMLSHQPLGSFMLTDYTSYSIC
jgi:hypothetical protein